MQLIPSTTRALFFLIPLFAGVLVLSLFTESEANAMGDVRFFVDDNYNQSASGLSDLFPNRNPNESNLCGPTAASAALSKVIEKDPTSVKKNTFTSRFNLESRLEKIRSFFSLMETDIHNGTGGGEFLINDVLGYTPRAGYQLYQYYSRYNDFARSHYAWAYGSSSASYLKNTKNHIETGMIPVISYGYYDNQCINWKTVDFSGIHSKIVKRRKCWLTRDGGHIAPMEGVTIGKGPDGQPAVTSYIVQNTYGSGDQYYGDLVPTQLGSKNVSDIKPFGDDTYNFFYTTVAGKWLVLESFQR